MPNPSCRLLGLASSPAPGDGAHPASKHPLIWCIDVHTGFFCTNLIMALILFKNYEGSSKIENEKFRGMISFSGRKLNIFGNFIPV